LIEKESNKLVGSVAIALIRSDVVYNLEYFIFPEYRGKGFAYEALSLLIEKAKAQELMLLKETVREDVYDKVPAVVKCIEAKTAADNIASIRLAEKLGFKKTGDIPLFKNHHGTYSDGVAYDYII
jgi:RimJ/RimL family protein N-acetyltransferase